MFSWTKIILKWKKILDKSIFIARQKIGQFLDFIMIQLL